MQKTTYRYDQADAVPYYFLNVCKSYLKKAAYQEYNQ